MAPNCAPLKCFGCDDVLCSKEGVSASVQPSSPQVTILKAAASSVQGAERCTALVWIGPLRGCSLSLWFRPVQGCRNRWCPGLSLQLTNHFFPVTQTLQRWSTEIVYRNSVVGKCRDGEGPQKAEGAGGLNISLLLASQPRSLAQAPRGERSAGRQGGRAALCRIRGTGGMWGMRMVCLSGQLQSEARGWLLLPSVVNPAGP